MTGSILDEAGNAVRPTRVSIHVNGGHDEECSTGFGWFRCSRTSDASYTLTLERGSDVYTDTASPRDGCDDLCMTFRPFSVTTAPDGACSPDTLPLVARLVSPDPGTLGAVERVWMNRQSDIDQTVLPADAVGDVTWAGTPGAYVQEIFAEPGLPSTEPLSMNVTVRADTVWCDAVGWLNRVNLDGRALLAFLPKPGSAPCSYDPLEIAVQPQDIIDCFNVFY